MKRLAVIALILAVSAACMAPKKPVSQASAQTQQSRAAAAQAEMERDIAAGTPSLTMPPAAAPAPVQDKPSAMLPPKSSVSKLGSLGPKTKYPIENGYPVWFFTPVYDGYIGAVGIAPKQSSVSGQKRVARMQAQKDLAKQIKVLVNSTVNVEQLNVDTETVKYYREKVSTLTREQVDLYLSGFKVMDEWQNPENGDYYMWMVLQR